MANKFYYAGFWKRFGAYFLDLIFIYFLTSPLRWIINDLIGISGNFEDSFSLETRTMGFNIWVFYTFIFQWCYFAAFESSPLMATPGKWAAGIYVSNMKGGRVTFGQASGRFFGKLLSSLLFGVGYLMAAFTPEKQALHDQLSACLVLDIVEEIEEEV